MSGSRDVGLAIALFALVAVGLWVHPYGAQQASRYALTAAITDGGTVVLDDYAGVLGRDRAVRDGHIYSDKAPGQPVLAIPFYLSYRAVGGEDATNLRIDENLGVWWQTFWFGSVPLAILGYLMYRQASRFSRASAYGTLALVFGTMLLPFGALLFGHVLSALFMYGAWTVVDRAHRTSRGRLAAAGALIGAGVITEYTAALAAVVIVVIALIRHRFATWWVLAGGLPFALLLGWYQSLAFGDPFTPSYAFSAFHDVTETARPVGSLFSSLQLDHLVEVFLSPRGFLVASPIVVIALFSAVAMMLRGRDVDHARIALIMFGLYLLIPLFWGNPWGGDSPGARYMVTALPFLVVPTSVAFERYRILSPFAALVGVVTMVAATITDPLLPPGGNWGLNIWWQWVLEGEFVPNVLGIWFGVPTQAVLLGLAVIVVVTGWYISSRANPSLGTDPEPGGDADHVVRP